MDLRVSTHAHEYKDLDAVKLFVNECAGHVLHGLFPAFALYELTGHGVHNKVSEVAVDKAAYPALHSQASLFIFGFEFAGQSGSFARTVYVFEPTTTPCFPVHSHLAFGFDCGTAELTNFTIFEN